MPNWCSNVLEVTGPKEVLQNFKKRFKGKKVIWPDPLIYGWQTKEEFEAEKKRREAEPEVFCFNALYPVPEEVIQKGFNDAGYDWCVSNWGTKWDADITLQEETEEKLVFMFDTAWAPPIGFIGKVSIDFPELTFRLDYFEPGVGFEGYMVIKNGECIESEHHDIVYEDWEEEDYEEIKEED